MKSFNLIWEKTLIYLQENLTHVQYQMWIKELKPVMVENDTFYFETTGDLHTKRLEEYLFDDLLSAFLRSYHEILGAPSQNFNIKFLNPTEAAKLLNKEKKNPNPYREYGYGSSEITLNPEYTFSTFVVGESNKFAHAAACSVVENPGFSHNPLFLYAGVGLGKTHLMHAIGNDIKKNNPDSNVVYVTSENFMNQLITMIREANSSIDSRVKFQRKYRSADVLMIDDIQFIAGSDTTQNEIFHTFNELHESNKQVIISSDRPPHELTQLEERIRSRFEWGGPIDISPPDFETRVAILMTKINFIKDKENVPFLPVSEDVYRYIAEQKNTNIRTLEGALKRVIIYAKTLNADSIDLSLAKEALFNYFSSAEKKPLTANLITEAVCRRYNISENDIFSSKKSRDIAYPRQIAMFLIRDLTEMSYEKIAKHFGKKDHTTIMHAANTIKNKIKKDESLGEEIENLKAKIKGL